MSVRYYGLPSTPASQNYWFMQAILIDTVNMTFFYGKVFSTKQMHSVNDYAAWFKFISRYIRRGHLIKQIITKSPIVKWHEYWPPKGWTRFDSSHPQLL